MASVCAGINFIGHLAGEPEREHAAFGRVGLVAGVYQRYKTACCGVHRLLVTDLRLARKKVVTEGSELDLQFVAFALRCMVYVLQWYGEIYADGRRILAVVDVNGVDNAAPYAGCKTQEKTAG